MMQEWPDLKYWDSGEYQVVQERLSDLAIVGRTFNPSSDKLFAALDATKFNDVKVVIVGQDPYPDARYATGLAFDIPAGFRKFPVTLQNIFREYCEDLQYPFPTNGSLKKWASRGVLLWNAIPSCETGKSLSHYGWFEWHYLTKEIIETLCNRDSPVVFCFLGGIARENAKYVTGKSKVIETSHPSPRVTNTKVPFIGSRMFSTANDYLVQLGQETIDWRL